MDKEKLKEESDKKSKSGGNMSEEDRKKLKDLLKDHRMVEGKYARRAKKINQLFTLLEQDIKDMVDMFEGSEFFKGPEEKRVFIDEMKGIEKRRSELLHSASELNRDLWSPDGMIQFAMMGKHWVREK